MNQARAVKMAPSSRLIWTCTLSIWFLILPAFPGLCIELGQQRITGYFYNEGDKTPIPGALVALYDARSNLLVDYTYTLQNGHFTLAKPANNGQFYIVATKENISAKTDPFKYNNEETSKNITINYPRHDRIGSDIYKIALDFMSKALWLLLGVISGYWFKLLEGKLKAKGILKLYLGGIAREADSLPRLHDELKNLVERYDSSANVRGDQKQYDSLMSNVRQCLQKMHEELSLRKDWVDLFDQAFGKKGVSDYRKLIDEIKSVSDFAMLNSQKTIVQDTKETMIDKLKPIRALRNENVLGNYV